MKKIFLFLSILLFHNCSLDRDSSYWNEDSIKNKENQKILSKILEKTDDITKMTVEEYKIYIDDHTKKSKYPDISK
tara:strand:- start:488 stop:715 length:228 start_codon:yes stop_codon:yes gene_type:complete